MNTPFNKWVYAAFTLFGLYAFLLLKDYGQSAIYLGLALAFDPFDTEKSWNERHSFEKGWLIIHLAVVAFLFGVSIAEID